MHLKAESRLKVTRVVGLSVIAFLCMLAYSMARPASESLFLESYSSRSLPMVWLLVAVGMFVAVSIYTRLVARMDLIRLFGLVSLASAIIFTLLLVAHRFGLPYVPYAIYVLKDVYVIVLVEIFYSYADSVFPIRSARWTYGLFGVVSALASVMGSMVVGPVAMRFGTAESLYVVPVLLVITWFVCIPFARAVRATSPLARRHAHADLCRAFSVVRASSYLMLLLGLIVLVQMIATMVDFEFNAVLERAYPAMDARTAVIGNVYAFINGITLGLHALTGPILRLVAVPSVMIAVPLFMMSSIGLFLISPAFAVVAVMKVMSKCFDYSIYKSAREMLYIPLTYEEKTLGKSIVDMLSYRIAKGGASVVIMGIVAAGLAAQMSWFALGMAALWMAISVAIIIRFRRKVTRREEIEKA